MNTEASKQPILSIDGLTVDFLSDDEPVRAVDNVSFHVHPGETLVILGESGSGKSVSTSTVMGLVTARPATSSRAASCSRARTWPAWATRRGAASTAARSP